MTKKRVEIHIGDRCAYSWPAEAIAGAKVRVLVIDAQGKKIVRTFELCAIHDVVYLKDKTTDT